MAVQELQQDKTLMKNDDVIKRLREKHISNWMIDDGNNRLLWKDKAPTPNEVIDILLAEIERAREECYEQMEGIIGEDDRGNSSHGNCCTCSGCRHYHDDCTCAENAVRAIQRSKLQALKEEL